MPLNFSFGGPQFRPITPIGIADFGPMTVVAQATNERKEDSRNPWFVDLINTGITGAVSIINTLKGRSPSGEPQPKYAAATGADPASGGASAKPEIDKTLMWVGIGVGVLALGAAVYAASK